MMILFIRRKGVALPEERLRLVRCDRFRLKTGTNDRVEDLEVWKPATDRASVAAFNPEYG